jgi:hypothetical protein
MSDPARQSDKNVSREILLSDCWAKLHNATSGGLEASAIARKLGPLALWMARLRPAAGSPAWAPVPHVQEAALPKSVASGNLSVNKAVIWWMPDR